MGTCPSPSPGLHDKPHTFMTASSTLERKGKLCATLKQPCYLTQFREDVLLLPEDDPVGLVGGSLVVVLQGEEVKQLGRTELVSPLVGSGAEIKQEGKQQLNK